ncbi:MAG: response regulator transcription factor [Flavobacteriales bacterium]
MHPLVPISMVIVHTSEAMRLGLRVAMERDGVAKVVLELAEPKGLAKVWPDETVQVVLLCLSAAMSLTLDAARWVRHRSPGTAVLVLGDLTPALARQALEAHVSGLLHSDALLTELVQSVSVTAQGGMHLNGLMREQLLAKKQRPGATAPPTDLPEMQLKVLRLLCHPKAYTRPQIAEALGISTRTVDDHLHALFAKFDVRSSRALVQKAIKLGLYP